MLELASIESIRQELGKSIAIIITDLGVRIKPDFYAQKRIIYYLLTYYQDLSIRDIQLAFELAIVGKINVDIEHYNSFDIRYLARTLNAFRKYRTEQQQKLKSHEKPLEISEKDKENIRIKYYKKLVKADITYKQTGVLPILFHWMAYNHILEIGVLQVSENYWTNLIYEAEKIYKYQLQQSNKKEHKEILKNFETVKYVYPFELTRIREIAKKLAIQDFFENLKNNNENLNDIFMKIGSYD